jgi:uncharacterized membrane protein YGL010W
LHRDERREKESEMNEVTTAEGPAQGNGPGLLARLVGVLLSPRETYAAVAARPRWFGALAVALLVTVAAQTWFVSTDVGKGLVMDQQVRAMESFGIQVSDQMYAQLEARMENAVYTTGASLLVFAPIVNAIMAGVIVMLFSMMMGGAGTFRQVFAIVAHSGVITALQQVFTVPLSLAIGRLAGANLAIFVPMLAEDSFVALFLGTIDLFLVWWVVSLAIGIGVLYKKKTGPIATAFLLIYGVIGLVIAFVRS